MNSGSGKQGSSLPRRSLLSWTALAGAGAATGGLAGCSSGSDAGDSDDKMKARIDNPSDNLNRKGFPIVDKPVTIKFMTMRDPKNASDFNKVASWKKYQKMSKVKVNWGLVPKESRDEKRNLALSSGDYPEVFCRCGFGNVDIVKYGDQGIFLRVNTLIDKYMPNLKKLMKQNPEIKAGMTSSDGNMYGMPDIVDRDFLGMRMPVKFWVRGDWLDKFDMDLPTTTDEYDEYLRAIKRKKPNGKDDAIPYCDYNQLIGLRQVLMGSFGVANRGSKLSIDADPKDSSKVRFYAITDGYKALVEYMHRLYRDGLIAQNVFSIDQAKVIDNAADGIYGSIADIAPGPHFGRKANKFVAMSALTGPEGKHDFSYVTSPMAGMGNFVLTDKNKHPAETARWLDYFYSGAGLKLYHMGVKGVSYKETDDGPEFITKIRKSSEPSVAQKPYVTVAGGFNFGLVKRKYFKSPEGSEESIKAAEKLEPDMLDEVWPGFTYTVEEAEKLDSVGGDIDKYVSESRDKFITGKLPLSSWNKYMEKIKQMGLDDYLTVQQDALDRYRKS